MRDDTLDWAGQPRVVLPPTTNPDTGIQTQLTMEGKYVVGMAITHPGHNPWPVKSNIQLGSGHARTSKKSS